MDICTSRGFDRAFGDLARELVERALASPIRFRVVVVVHDQVSRRRQSGVEEPQAREGGAVEVEIDQDEREALVLEADERLRNSPRSNPYVGVRPDVSRHRGRTGVSKAHVNRAVRVEIAR